MDKFRITIKYNIVMFDIPAAPCRCSLIVEADEHRASTMRLVNLLNKAYHHNDGDTFTMEFESASWDGLSQKVDSMVASLKRQLKKIKRSYDGLLASQPKDQSFAIEI